MAKVFIDGHDGDVAVGPTLGSILWGAVADPHGDDLGDSQLRVVPVNASRRAVSSFKRTARAPLLFCLVAIGFLRLAENFVQGFWFYLASKSQLHEVARQSVGKLLALFDHR